MSYYSKRVNLFNRVELLGAADLGRYTTARDILEANDIKFQVRAKSNANNISRSRNPRFGRSMELKMRYYIYVRKEDYEKAKFLIK